MLEVGRLIYIMTYQPDLNWVFSKISQHLAAPKPHHWTTVKHVLRYFKGTLNQELCYRKQDEGLQLEGYSDVDWAVDRGAQVSIFSA